MISCEAEMESLSHALHVSGDWSCVSRSQAGPPDYEPIPIQAQVTMHMHIMVELG